MTKATLLFTAALCATIATAQEVSITHCTAFWKTGVPVGDTYLDLFIESPGLPGVHIYSLSETGDCETLDLEPNAYPNGSEFSFTAGRDGGDLNGVTVLDLVTIRDHILGLQPLADPYGILAADVNQSNSVTTFDMVELNKLLLGFYSELPAGSWRFFPENCTFPTPGNPFNSSTCPPYTVADLFALDGDTLMITGVKMGDVDGDANPAGSYAGPLYDDSISLKLPALDVAPGASLVVPIRYDDNAYALTGLQLEMWMDAGKLSLDSIVDASTGLTESYVLTPQGTFRVLLLTPPFTSGLNETTLHNLYFTAKPAGPGFEQPVPLEAVLQLKSDVFAPLAVDEDHTTRLNVSYEYETASATSSPLSGKLASPASPNPFHHHCAIQLRLDRAERVRLDVFDPVGQLRHTSERLLAPGSHQLDIPAGAVTPGGIGYYRLQVGERAEMGKLVRY